MKGNQKVIAALNEAIALEMEAITTYFLHSEMADNQGYDKLSKFFKCKSREEMKHCERFIERCLFLEGTPEIVLNATIGAWGAYDEMIEQDIRLETETSEAYNRLAGICVANDDRVSEKLFKDILEEEERHLDEFESERDKQAGMTMPVYLGRQVTDED